LPISSMTFFVTLPAILPQKNDLSCTGGATTKAIKG